VVLDLGLGWHTWRHHESERSERVRWEEAKGFVERLLPVGTEVLLISEKLEKYGRTLGRIVLRDGRDVGVELLKAGLAVPYEGGRR
jgi:endonuclease YncB( thermonuclease family)